MKKLLLFSLVIVITVAGCSVLKEREYPLRVTTDPPDAKVKVTELPKKNRYKPVKIKVIKFGTSTIKGRPKTPSFQVYIYLSKKGYLQLGETISNDEPKERAVKLIEFSTDQSNLKDSFTKAGKQMKLPVAYPSYIPDGFKVKRAEAANFTPNDKVSDGIVVEWAKGNERINFTTLPYIVTEFQQRNKVKERVRKINILKNYYSEINDDNHSNRYIHAHFFANRKMLNWELLIVNLPKEEALKIIKKVTPIKSTI